MRIHIGRWVRPLTLVVACLVARDLAAQKSYIKLTEPAAWAEDRVLEIEPGHPIHVRGAVFDTSGVQQVLIDGRSVPLTRQGNLMAFSVDVMPGLGSTHDIIAVPVSGPRFTEVYRVDFVTASDTAVTRPAMPAATAARDTTTRDTAAVIQTRPVPAAVIRDTAVTPQEPVMGGRRTMSPAFQKRAYGYAGGVVVGAILATLKSSTSSVACRQVGGGQDCFNRVESKPKFAGVGLALIGVSVVAGIVDFFQSSTMEPR
jgi:hypothetical protein